MCIRDRSRRPRAFVGPVEHPPLRVGEDCEEKSADQRGFQPASRVIPTKLPNLSRSVTSTSIRPMFGRIDRSRRVLEARQKALRRHGRSNWKMWHPRRLGPRMRAREITRQAAPRDEDRGDRGPRRVHGRPARAGGAGEGRPRGRAAAFRRRRAMGPRRRVRAVARREDIESSTRLQRERTAPESSARASSTRRERSIRPKIGRVDVDATELERSEVRRGPPGSRVEFHAGRPRGSARSSERSAARSCSSGAG